MKYQYKIYHWQEEDGNMAYGFKFGGVQFAMSATKDNLPRALEACLNSLKVLDLFGKKYLKKNNELNIPMFNSDLWKNEELYKKFLKHEVDYIIVNKKGLK